MQFKGIPGNDIASKTHINAPGDIDKSKRDQPNFGKWNLTFKPCGHRIKAITKSVLAIRNKLYDWHVQCLLCCFTSQATFFQSCPDKATASCVLNITVLWRVNIDALCNCKIRLFEYLTLYSQ